MQEVYTFRSVLDMQVHYHVLSYKAVMRFGL